VEPCTLEEKRRVLPPRRTKFVLFCEEKYRTLSDQSKAMKVLYLLHNLPPVAWCNGATLTHEQFLPSTQFVQPCDVTKHNPKGNGTPKTAGAIARRRATLGDRYMGNMKAYRHARGCRAERASRARCCPTLSFSSSCLVFTHNSTIPLASTYGVGKHTEPREILCRRGWSLTSMLML
jgi:hypothetical protein